MMDRSVAERTDTCGLMKRARPAQQRRSGCHETISQEAAIKSARRTWRIVHVLLVPLILLVSLATGAQGQEETEYADEDEGGSNDQNSEVAKSVEAWLPFVLGGILVMAVVGWCMFNVMRASKDDEEEDRKNKAPISLAAVQDHNSRKNPMNSQWNSQNRSGADTGDVSPNFDVEAGRGVGGVRNNNVHRMESYRSSTGAGDIVRGLGSELPSLVFVGDELQGKKAPGETGGVYQNPLSKHAGMVLNSGKAGASRGYPAAVEIIPVGSGSDSSPTRKDSRLDSAGKDGKAAKTSKGKKDGKSRDSKEVTSSTSRKSRWARNSGKDEAARNGIGGGGGTAVKAPGDSLPHLRPGVALAGRPMTIPVSFSAERDV